MTPRLVKRHLTLSLMVLFLAMSLLACERSGEPRRSPYPSFDATQPFPELAGEEAEASAGIGEDPSFEESIDAARNGEGEGSEGLAPGASYQKIPLASVFVAEVPLLFDEWQYATDGVSTLLVHHKPGALPDAVIYVEAFSQAVEQFPSYEVARFQFTIDPGLSPSAVYPPLGAAAMTWAREQSAPPMQVLLGLQLATTRTMGMGLGFDSTPGAFTGWRWVGRTSEGLDARFGRTLGRWETPRLPGDLAMETILTEFAQRVPEFAPIAERLRTFAQFPPEQRRAPSAAWMVIGSVARQHNPSLGVHLAILCEQRPVCPVSRELAHMLATLRPIEDRSQVAAPAAETVVDFAAMMGMKLLDPSQTISAPEMMVLLEQARQREQREASGELPEEAPPQEQPEQ